MESRSDTFFDRTALRVFPAGTGIPFVSGIQMDGKPDGLSGHEQSLRAGMPFSVRVGISADKNEVHPHFRL